MADLRRINGRDKPWDVRFWGIGNESWGCGGNMTPEFYADVYRRYATYVRNYGKPDDRPPYKIACGSSGEDMNWTRVLMERAGKQMNGLSLHYYTVPGLWPNKGNALDFGEKDWYVTLVKASHMEDLVAQHSAIMDEFDRERRVGLIVDEWGTWYEVEPGTNPGFLYQQNSLRDALVAAITFNVFNNHAERVYMANIAQTINVLQSVILTDGPRMVLTPTYHAFDMYQVHHDAVKLPLYIESETVSAGGEMPLISASASQTDDGGINLSLTNADAKAERQAWVELRGLTLSASLKLSGSSISADTLQAHNSFDNPEAVSIKPFSGTKIEGGKLCITLPPASVVTVNVK
jgi:alpha-N-arabinofuranosidase